MRPVRATIGAVFLALAVVGCSAVPDASRTAVPTAQPQPSASESAPQSTDDSPAAASTPASKAPKVFQATWPTPAPTWDPNGPAVVFDAEEPGLHVFDGLLVVSKKYPLPRSYVPEWASKPHGLHPDAYAAANKLIAAAKADGLKLTIRSGYRDYNAQSASFANAMRTYPESTARMYFAEAGKSEHQTGLSLDVWDGVNRGTAFARLPQAKWLAANAHRFGFIIRYPQGKEHITGYAWESWHLRYVGTKVSSQFGANSSLTLEEYLGLA